MSKWLPGSYTHGKLRTEEIEVRKGLLNSKEERKRRLRKRRVKPKKRDLNERYQGSDDVRRCEVREGGPLGEKVNSSSLKLDAEAYWFKSSSGQRGHSSKRRVCALQARGCECNSHCLQG